VFEVKFSHRNFLTKGYKVNISNNEQAAQEQQATAEVQAALQTMLAEVKRKLKPESKNELIRIIGALLVDNYSLKMQLQALQPQESVSNEVSST
jgi:hypothetical protein